MFILTCVLIQRISRGRKLLAQITTKVICDCCLLKSFRSLYKKQWSSLMHAVCFYSSSQLCITLQKGAFFKYWPIWFEDCGYMRHKCLPNVSPNHVIRPIGWFKLVVNLRHNLSLKPLFWPGHVGKCFQKCFSVENLFMVSLNTVITIIVVF